MNLRPIYIAMLVSMLTTTSCVDTQKKERYDQSWESMAEHQAVPDWLKDAKFGIYFHWGAYCVPENESEWYPKMMFSPGPAKEFHTKTYGDPNKTGYQCIIPLFKAEKFNAREWAALFKKSGAKFAGPVAEHHDGFSMWKSDVNPWNAYDMGPERDIVGEMAEAVKGQGMKFITTFHHSRNLNRYTTPESIAEQMAKDFKPEVEFSRFPLSHYPQYPDATMTRSTDPMLRILYGNMPEKEWCETLWFPKLKEVIDRYQPDIIWFDSWLDQVPEDYRAKFCAYYLNAADRWGRDVAIIRKQDDLPLSVSMKDFERSRSSEIKESVWMTDETINTGNSWSYLPSLVVKPAAEVLGILADNVSKNGVLLFNISPKADGSIPEDQQSMLLELGDWLGKYGESIYSTDVWSVYGEGPTTQPSGDGHHGWRSYKDVKYSEKDIRMTQNEEYVYAIIMGRPQSGDKYLITSFAKENLPADFEAQSVELMLSRDKLSWEFTSEGLAVTMPNDIPNEMMQVIRVKK